MTKGFVPNAQGTYAVYIGHRVHLHDMTSEETLT